VWLRHVHLLQALAVEGLDVHLCNLSRVGVAAIGDAVAVEYQLRGIFVAAGKSDDGTVGGVQDLVHHALVGHLLGVGMCRA